MKKVKVKVHFSNPQLDDIEIDNMQDFVWEQPTNILKILKTDGEFFIKLNDVVYIKTEEQIENKANTKLIKVKVVYNDNGVVRTELIDNVFLLRWFDEDYYLRVMSTEGIYLFNLRHICYAEAIDKQKEVELEANNKQKETKEEYQEEIEYKGNIRKPTLEKINRFRGRKKRK